MSQTSTPTFGMRLSCNFVNVYTIAYRVQYMSIRVHAHILNGHPLDDTREENRACRTTVVGEDPRACSARGERSYSCGKLNREVTGQADILVTILARTSARMSVSVSWNSSFSLHGDGRGLKIRRECSYTP